MGPGRIWPGCGAAGAVNGPGRVIDGEVEEVDGVSMLKVGRADRAARDAVDASALAERSMVTGMTGRPGREAADGVAVSFFDLDFGGDADRPVKRLMNDAKPPDDLGASVLADRDDCVVLMIGRA